MNRKIGFIIQCRDGSTRYKHKSIRPFYKNKSILELIVEKLKYCIYPTIVATSMRSSKTIKVCKEIGVDCYTGDEEDVLERVFECADMHFFDGIIRICADNPFFDIGLMYPILTWGEIGDYDYVSFDSAMRRHEGFFCEYISMNALKEAHERAILKTDREHVTPYIVRHPDVFREKILPIPEPLNDVSIRLTVDSEQDFETAQQVYLMCDARHWKFILEYVAENKLMQANMLREIALNPKRVQ